MGEERDRLSQYIVFRDDTIESAIAAIEHNSHRSAIVLDQDNKVVGTISDGDIRKAIINHRLLSTPVAELMNLNFIWVGPDERGKAVALFERHHIFLIPVLDEGNALLDVIVAY